MGKENGTMYRSQTRKALEALRMYGDKGCYSFMLSRLIGTNWSPRRIYDLRKQGYHITSKTEEMDGSKGTRYFLHEQKIEPKKYVFDFENNRCYQI